jgi:hypothetical protein
MLDKVLARCARTPADRKRIARPGSVDSQSPRLRRAPLPRGLSLLILLALSGTGMAQQDDYFARVDLDGNGSVSLNEFLERMSFAFRQMDVDGDEVLEPHEQHIPDAKAITLAEHHERFTAQFRRQDSDRDGSLSRREYLAPPR